MKEVGLECVSRMGRTWRGRFSILVEDEVPSRWSVGDAGLLALWPQCTHYLSPGARF